MRRFPRDWARILAVAAIVTVAAVVAGCGQKGPLYLPKADNAPVAAAPVTTASAPQTGAVPAGRP